MFKPGWKMTLFTLAFSPLLFTLGQWQLDREQEKIQLQKQYEQRDAEPEIDVDTLDWTQEDLSFLKVQAHGEFVNDTVFLLDNRIHQGRVGYELINPFVTDGGLTLLLNRGWIAQGASREVLPDIPEVLGPVEIKGSIYIPLEEPFLLSSVEEVSRGGGPRVIQSLDVDKLSATLEKNLAPYSVRLSASSPGLEQANWPLINTEPEKHRGYAVQWFTMLFALIIMYIYFGFKNPRLQRDRD